MIVVTTREMPALAPGERPEGDVDFSLGGAVAAAGELVLVLDRLADVAELEKEMVVLLGLGPGLDKTAWDTA